MRETFNGGYSKALLDVANWFDTHSCSLKYNRLYNSESIPKVLAALLENREELRETGDCELVYNPKTKEIECAKNNRG